MIIAGIDEAGRGALFGPLVVACVVLPKSPAIQSMFSDSKQLSSQQRESLYCSVLDHAIDCSVSCVSSKKIDELNVLGATLYGMKKVMYKLRTVPDKFLIDGNKVPTQVMSKKGHDIPVQAIVKGDATQPAISAASIVAKVVRDTLIQRISLQYPDYGFERHKGYGTNGHYQAILKYGLHPLHRKSFNLTKQLTMF